MTEKMHCPKCGQKYPDAYQRFCDTDGSRLVPDDVGPIRDTGVFTSILGKQAGSQRSATQFPEELALEDRRVEVDRRKDLRLRALFDQIDLDDADLASDSFVIEEAPRSKTTVTARRIAPNEIPSGTVNLAEREASPNYLHQFDPENPEAFVGSTVKGRYGVTELIGEDDTGCAYLAEDRIVNDRRVIVRVLPNEPGYDEVTNSIIAEERVSLSHINHPNVARLFDSGSWPDGTTYVISEHLEELTLKDVLTIHTRLAPERAGRVIRQAAYALSEVHQEGILHRDIRTSNLVLVKDGENEIVKIASFGVSDGIPNAANAAYQSPETLAGDVPTSASDEFSLAVVAYELLNGELPFQGETDADVVREQKKFAKTEPASDIEAVFVKALALDPRDRFATAREFGDAFALAVSTIEHTPSGQSADAPADPNVVPFDPTLKVDGTPMSPDDPQWARRSPEPIAEPDQAHMRMIAIGLGILLIAVLVGAFLLSRQTAPTGVASDAPVNEADQSDRAVVPPLERRIPQPENTVYFQSSKQSVRGDLIRNFVGFKLYYPKDWTDNRGRESVVPGRRGKFLDISKPAANGGISEQMLVSYYPSKGTFADDEIRFPDLVKEATDTLKELIPNFQVVSQGPTKVNDWHAYELKFQGNDASGKVVVWGRRLFVPAARPGTRNGFEITMLATSHSPNVRSVDDVGIKGDLGPILYSFEPSQNF